MSRIPVDANDSIVHPIRWALVDDHVMVRQGLRRMLEGFGDLVMVGESGDGLRAVDMVIRCLPDVVIVNVSLPNLSGIEITRRIVKEVGQTKVIGLTYNMDPPMFRGMIAAGAAACVSMEPSVEELYLTIVETNQERKGNLGDVVDSLD